MKFDKKMGSRKIALQPVGKRKAVSDALDEKRAEERAELSEISAYSDIEKGNDFLDDDCHYPIG